MAKKFKNSLFIFRRDVRLQDNTALIAAAKESEYVIPCFIIDPRQTEQTNPYRSLNAIQFMKEALNDLTSNLQDQGAKLYVWVGTADTVFAHIIQSVPIDALYTNRDYTPFSANRDETLKKLCFEHGIEFIQKNDLLLIEPENIATGNGTPYTIFTPFFKRAMQIPVKQPDNFTITNWYTKPIKETLDNIDQAFESYNNIHLHVHGTVVLAKKILSSIDTFENYNNTHDYPYIETTNLSAYNKFGIVSIREVYHAIAQKLGQASPIARQLYWRDFFTHVAYFSPFVFGHAFKKQYENIEWQNNPVYIQAWCSGHTGFPIVDAGMRQLNKTGYMHNRVRLITSSFLVKDLHVDWRLGEQYFAQKLVDYDPAVNNGNWQWVASTGTDAQPYFRIFNPWLQQKKFDSDCKYIKKWIPELATTQPSIIHSWFKINNNTANKYPKPIIDHAQESSLSKSLYKQIID